MGLKTYKKKASPLTSKNYKKSTWRYTYWRNRVARTLSLRLSKAPYTSAKKIATRELISDAVSCTVLRTSRIASRSSSEGLTEEEVEATLIGAAIARGQGQGQGRGVRLVKSTGDSPSDDVEVLIHIEEPAVEPNDGFAAFDGTGTLTSIATSALCFDWRTGAGTFALTAATGEGASTTAAEGDKTGEGRAQATRTW